MFYLTTHSTHFIYGYMASDIWLRTILIVRKETRCHHIGYSYRLTARVLLYAPSHRQDSTYHSLCYTSRGALAGTRNSSMGPPYEGPIRRSIAPWANALPLCYVPLRDKERERQKESGWVSVCGCGCYTTTTTTPTTTSTFAAAATTTTNIIIITIIIITIIIIINGWDHNDGYWCWFHVGYQTELVEHWTLH